MRNISLTILCCSSQQEIDNKFLYLQDKSIPFGCKNLLKAMTKLPADPKDI